jgi:hypothetical protein
MKKTTLNICILLISFITFSCGTLGGFDTRTLQVKKNELNKAFDTLYSKYPNYKIPNKWKKFDDWNERGYDFLDARLIYFENSPEEMYYLTFIGDSITTSNSQTSVISIRAICNGSAKWLLVSDFSKAQKERIEKRLDEEIISKLEFYLNIKSIHEKH